MVLIVQKHIIQIRGPESLDCRLVVTLVENLWIESLGKVEKAGHVSIQPESQESCYELCNLCVYLVLQAQEVRFRDRKCG